MDSVGSEPMFDVQFNTLQIDRLPITKQVRFSLENYIDIEQYSAKIVYQTQVLTSNFQTSFLRERLGRRTKSVLALRTAVQV